MLCYRKPQLSFDLGYRKTYFTMNAAYASRYEAAFLYLHPKGPKMYGAAAKYMKKSKTFTNKTISMSMTC